LSDWTRLGVLGWPVAHSRSPQMMGAALRTAGLAGWRYQRLPLPPALFAETVAALGGAGFRGVNVTIPHKQAALAVADGPTDRAKAIGAANTLVFESSGAIVADNTDAPAFIEALPTPPAGRSALVLGAGGTARAVVWALASAGAAEVCIWNRNPERARELAEELGARVVSEAGPADVLVNCTPVGRQPKDLSFKQLPVRADELAMFGCIVDFVYGWGETALVQSARALGVPTVDGLDLLVGQGALSFERFTSLPAPVREMRAAAHHA
jgi:shikimate dehydrogenase